MGQAGFFDAKFPRPPLKMRRAFVFAPKDGLPVGLNPLRKAVLIDGRISRLAAVKSRLARSTDASRKPVTSAPRPTRALGTRAGRQRLSEAYRNSRKTRPQAPRSIRRRARRRQKRQDLSFLRTKRLTIAEDKTAGDSLFPKKQTARCRESDKSGSPSGRKYSETAPASSPRPKRFLSSPRIASAPKQSLPEKSAGKTIRFPAQLARRAHNRVFAE